MLIFLNITLLVISLITHSKLHFNKIYIWKYEGMYSYLPRLGFISKDIRYRYLVHTFLKKSQGPFNK